MRLDTIIFNSELEFRNYVIQNLKTIDGLIIFEDPLEDVLFFYGFWQNSVVIATKEHSCSKFEKYKKIYKKIANMYYLNANCNITNFLKQEELI